jgi:lysozyme
MTTTDRKKKMSIAAAVAILIAAPAEGLRQVAYYDPPGILTVCAGHTGPDVDPQKVYSLEECDKLLTDDMRKAVAAVDRCVPDAPPNVLAAFGDAAFNLGPAIACDTNRSTAARHLKAGQWGEACAQLKRWNRARVAGVMVELPGLTKRRQAEFTLCMRGLT